MPQWEIDNAPYSLRGHVELLPAAYRLPEPIRPRPCPEYRQGETVDMHQERCHECAGIMFEYPDPPGFWSSFVADHVAGSSGIAVGLVDWKPTDWVDWYRFCDLTWAVLKVRKVA